MREARGGREEDENGAQINRRRKSKRNREACRGEGEKEREVK